MESLQKEFHSDKFDAHEYGHWVKLLNTDSANDSPNETHYNISDFEKAWANERTYKRWENSGCWYGFSYHSGALLASVPNDKNYYINVAKHFREMYFDQTLFLFYLRVSLFRFSTALSTIAEQLDESNGYKNKPIIEQLEHIRKQFSKFTILYQFPLLSNQQQSIEMYNLAREFLDVDEFYKEIKSEIDSTHEFLEIAEGRKLTQTANRIAKYGIPLAAMALVSSLYAINIGQQSLCEVLLPANYCSGNYIISVILGTGVATYLTMKLYQGKK